MELTNLSLKRADDVSAYITILLNAHQGKHEESILPSIYMKEMKLSTEERIETMKTKLKILDNMNDCIFEATPQLVVFQNFIPGTIYTAILSLCNNDTVSRPLRPIIPRSPYFYVEYASDSISTRIAPGMSTIFNIRFCADDIKDYSYEITFTTEDQTFIIPIIAIRPRPLLDIPDYIKLPTAAVKVGCERIIQIKNFGQGSAIYTMHTKFPFSVNPNKGNLLPNHDMQLTIYFKPIHVGRVVDYLIISYENGEKLAIKLEAHAVNSNIALEKGSLLHERTFIGLSRQRKITLFNNSDHICRFKWKMNESFSIDQEHAKKLKNSLKFMKEHETIRSNNLEAYGVIDGECHAKIYDRIYKDELREFNCEEEFLYQHPNFQVTPLTGEVWPNGRFDFVIIFSPSASLTYKSKLYLEVTGLDDRLPLTLNGIGIGPSVCLNVNVLEINKIYMCSIHQYAIAACNKGDIPAQIIYKPKDTEFGGVFTCLPHSISLDPGENGTFTIQFTSRQQGKFCEIVLFDIKDSNETVEFQFKGEIVAPLLQFSASKIDLGVVPIGYTVEQSVELHNQVNVAIPFELYIDGDGDVPAISCDEFTLHQCKGRILDKPKEFEISPAVGTVLGNTSLNVQIKLTANKIRKHTTHLIGRFWDSDKHVTLVPLKFQAATPAITCSPPEVIIMFCFITYPYNRTIILQNSSPLPGYVDVFPKERSLENGIKCTTSATHNFIKPYGELEICLTIKSTFLGKDSLELFMTLFGDEPKHCCTIICKGQGPVVSIEPQEVYFGTVTLLEETSRELMIFNESPIKASVDITVNPNQHFMIEPRSLVLGPEQSAVLTISVYLCNPINTKALLKINTDNGGSDVTCVLKAKGVGTSILCQPKLHPLLDIGLYLTHQKITLPVTFTNKGIRGHKLFWSRFPKLKQLSEPPDLTIDSVFSITPKAFELNSQESISGYIEGITATQGYIEEDFYCYAAIENVKSKQIIISTVITARFIEPVILKSKPELKFRKDIGLTKTLEFLIDDLTITNNTGMPISMDLRVSAPFHMLIGSTLDRQNSLNLELLDDQSYHILLEFDPHTEEKRCMKVQKNFLIDFHDHPNVERLPLSGEVNYPNIQMLPNFIEFPNTSSNSICNQEIILQNISPLVAIYHFEWDEAMTVYHEIVSPKLVLPACSAESLFTKASSDSGIYLEQLEFQKIQKLKEELENHDEAIKVITLPGSKDTLINVEDLDSDLEESLLPVEKVFHKSHIEQYEGYHHIQVQDTIKPELYMIDVLSFPQHNLEYIKQMHTMLYGLVSYFNGCESDVDVLKTLPKVQDTPLNINSILKMSPICGKLKPFEKQILSVTFHPLHNFAISTEATCHVLGGASETLKIKAKSSDLCYSISSLNVNFGRQVFCQTSEKTITLTNTGYSEFEFIVSAKEYPNPTYSAYILEVGYLTVTPKFGKVMPQSSVTFYIEYFPGIAGEFNENFSVQIGHLLPLVITVHGYGVFPQVFLYLPRPSFDSLNPSITYRAVASLTPDYLKSLENVTNILHYNDPLNYEEDIPKIGRQKLMRDGWVIISYNNLYPSLMDIELAVERIILYQNLFNDPSILISHTTTHKAVVVPNFITPPYLADFGYVVLDTTVYCTVLIFNYGPTNAHIKLYGLGNKKSPFALAGFKVLFKPCTLEIGETTELCIEFHPQIEVYSKLDCKVSHPVYLDIGHGSRILIAVKAIVTVPAVSAESPILEFETVRCGDCIKRSMILHNEGQVVSEWRASTMPLKKSRKPPLKQSLCPKPVFFLTHSSGILEPGCRYILDVFFEPQNKGKFEWLLLIDITQNLEKTVVSLKGTGIEPSLKITEDEVHFPSILPYTQKCEQYFLIENVSTSPIEFYFADFDTEIDEEEKIINILTQLYKRCELYIPPRIAGNKLPQSFVNFYQQLLNSLKEKLIKLERPIMPDDLRTVSRGSDNPSVGSKQSSRRNSLRSKSPQTSLHAASQSREDFDPLATKTPKEIEQLMKDHLLEFISQPNLKSTTSTVPAELIDPISAAAIEAKGSIHEKDPTDIREGVFIIFHGGPTANINQVANRAGLDVGLPVYSIDRLFYESLAANGSSATTVINNLINNAFHEVASEIDLVVEEDLYDEIEKKINLLQSGKEKKPKPKSAKKSDSKSTSKKDKKGSKESSKKSESKKSGKKKKDTRPTFIGLPEDMLFEILRDRLLLFKTGIVIESLRSIFLRQPLVALNNLLKAIGNVYYIQCIVLSYTYQDNLAFENILKFKAEQQALAQREAIIQKSFKTDTTELTEEELTIFREYVLNVRKLKTLEKGEALKKRLLEVKTMGKGKQKKGAKSGTTKVVDIKEKDKKSQTTKASSGKSKTDKKKSGGAKSNKSSKSTKQSKSSKSSKSKKTKLSPEEMEIKQLFNSFESDFEVILHTLEHWDRKTGVCLMPLAQGKKGGSSKKQSKSSKASKQTSAKLKTPKSASSQIHTLVVEPVTPEQETKLLQTGIPCWVYCNAHKEKPIETIISNYLQHTPELQKAKYNLEEDLKEKLVETIEMFTVLQKLQLERTKNQSDVFIIEDGGEVMLRTSLDSQLVKESSNTSILESLSKKSYGSKLSIEQKPKRRRSKNKSKESKLSISSLGSMKQHSLSADKMMLKSGAIEMEHIFTTRCVLHPGEVKRYKATYLPRASGNHTHTFTIEVTGWSTKYYIVCTGKCDIPRIDMRPEALFQKIAKKRVTRNMFDNCIFLRELDVFDFGSVLLQEQDKDKALEVCTQFSFVNTSLLQCEASFSFRSSAAAFKFEPELMTIEPNSTGNLSICAIPMSTETSEDQLLISIKNSPKIEMINIASDGCKFAFNIEPKQVTYDRIPINRLETRILNLENQSLVAVIWQLTLVESISQYYKVFPIEGTIKANSTARVTFEFESDKGQTISAQKMQIQVFDKNGKCDFPLLKDFIEISAEAVEVNIEYLTEIHFGEVKGRFENIELYTIVSKGKYNVGFEFANITKDQDNLFEEHATIRSYFTVVPMTGILQSNKMFTITITLFAKKATEFRNVPIINCTLFDPVYKTEIETFTLKASAKTYFARFEICPPERMNFGHQLIGIQQSQDMTIKNNGKFSFNYSILSLRKLLDQKKGKDKKDKLKGSKSSKSNKSKVSKKESKNTKVSKSSKKSSKSTKSDAKKKPKPTKLDAGIFSVISSTGILDPNETVLVKVSANPKQVGKFEETIVVFISECTLAEKKGTYIVLTATGCIPNINFKSYNSIFREQYIVDSFKDMVNTAELSSHCIFIKDEMQLDFGHRMINRKAETKMYFENTGAVPINIRTNLTPIPDSNFTIVDNQIYVASYSSSCTTISFLPNRIGEFLATLLVTYDAPQGITAETMTVKLHGSGLVPEIVLKEPEFNGLVGCYSINFSPTAVGKISHQVVSFENIGVIPCRVIIEVCDGQVDDFVLMPHMDTVPFLQIFEKDILNTAHTNMVHLQPGQNSTFQLQYQPTIEAQMSCLIKLHIVDNPFETFMIFVTAESFSSDVTILDLPTIAIKKSETFGGIQFPTTGYNLNFEYPCMNTLYTKCFTITNQSQCDIYKFEFAFSDKIIFIPSVGHLKPKASKEIITRFLSKEPVILDKEPFACTISKIEYLEHQLEPLSWDSRQNYVVWEPTQLKLSEDSNHSDMPVHLSTIIETEMLPIASKEPQLEGMCELERRDSEEVHSVLSQKSIQEKGEPPIMIVENTTKFLMLLVSAACDYASYEYCEEEIEIEATLAFDERATHFTLKNNSLSALDLDWKISMGTGYPKRVDGVDLIDGCDACMPEESKLDTMSRSCLELTHLSGKEQFLHYDYTTHSSSSLFSTEVGLTNHSDEIWNESNVMPFTISPSVVSIKPKQEHTFKVNFAPKDVLEYMIHLQSDVKNLHSFIKPLNITVKAQSILPTCYFDIPASSYITERRKGRKMCGDIADNHTSVIEFESLGVGVTIMKKFKIRNPTREGYFYTWKPVEMNNNDANLFNCRKLTGFIDKGKSTDAIFSFMPQTVGTFEAFYTFNIEKLDFTKVFLLVGVAKEPYVYFTTPHLQMKPTILGKDVIDYITLKNNNDKDLDYKVRSDSLYADARSQCLYVETLKGTLKPNSETQIKVVFHPVRKGETNFSLKCAVEKVRKPILINITANCFILESMVSYVSESGTRLILELNKINIIQLNSMIPQKKQQIDFTIANLGHVGYYYSWSIVDISFERKVRLNFENDEGYVKSKSSTITELSILPLVKLFVKKLEIKLQIRYGPAYVIHLTGSLKAVLYGFSIQDIDFGQCLVQKENTDYYSKIIEFNNNDKMPVTLECGVPALDFLTINFKTKIIKPRKTEKLTILFHPLEVKQYHTEIPFYVDSKLQVVKMKGQGVLSSIQLKDSWENILDLGCIPIGKQISKVVQIVNESTAAVDIIFNLFDRLPYFSRKSKVLPPEFEKEEPPPPPKCKASKKGKKDKKDKGGSKKGSKKSGGSSKKTASTKDSKKGSKATKSSKSSKSSKKEKEKKTKSAPAVEVFVETPAMKEKRLIREFIKFTPQEFGRVLPHQCFEFTITFSPTERMPTFVEKVSYQIQDSVETLCLLKACCIGPYYKLDAECISFGSIIIGCGSQKKLALHNLGDIGGRFKWSFQKLQQCFTITPDEGYISPSSVIAFSVRYKPTAISCFYEVKTKCNIEGLKQPLDLTLTGTCIDLPPPIETIKFMCPVRLSDSKEILIQNITGEVWNINPIVQGQYFIVPDLFIIDPNSGNTCEVKYLPMTMSGVKPHEASILFNLPNGQGLLYNLIGISQPPHPVEIITLEITCKTYHTEVLKVNNWLKIPQNFTVISESTLPFSVTKKTLYKITGNDNIEVFGQDSRDYAWTIYVINQGVLNFKVIFKNLKTNEYLYYVIGLTIGECLPLDIVELTTCVRIPVSYKLKLQNPIKTPVVFKMTATTSELHFENPITVAPYSEHEVQIKYEPLTIGKFESNLNIVTNDLGNSIYKFILTSHLPVPEEHISINTNLGQINTAQATLVNPTSLKIDFAMQMLHPDIFYIPDPLSLGPKEKGTFEIVFDPNSVGTIQSSLTVSSPATGPYIFPLVATCNLPKPQGPYFISPGNSTTIMFRNPFDDITLFNFAVEPAIFSLKSTCETIKPKKDVKIVVNLAPLKNLEILIDRKYPLTGKLFVHCGDPKLSYIKWLYYLQGEV